MPVPERFAPPARNGVEDLASVRQDEPGALGAHHLERWQGALVREVAARMPNDVGVAEKEVAHEGSVAGDGPRTAASNAT